MVMNSIQIRLTKNQIAQIEKIVKTGNYPSRSEFIRDVVRREIEKFNEEANKNVTKKNVKKTKNHK